MNESIGSIYPMFFMVVFVVIASGYMAFNVNYNKAFKMKNKIVDEINRSNGDGCFVTSGKCYSNIVNYAKSIGYKPAELDCKKPYKSDPSKIYYCYAEIGRRSDLGSSKNGHYYDVYTRIDISVPLVENLLDLKVLNVYGSTNTVKK